MLNKTSYTSNVWWLGLYFSVGTSLQYAVEYSNSVHQRGRIFEVISS